MGTPFEDIFEKAMFKFSDYAFLDFKVDLKADIMRQHLLSAIVDFTRASAIPLTYSRLEKLLPELDSPNDNGPDYDGVVPLDYSGDDGYNENEAIVHQYIFDYDLGLEEQEILALGLVYNWLSGKVLNSELLRNIMHNRDYTSYSPANLLREMQSLRNAVKQEFIGRINTYSFRNSNLQNMRTGW